MTLLLKGKPNNWLWEFWILCVYPICFNHLKVFKEEMFTFLYHSYIIPISFLYHSYIIPISFLYHSYIIPISFLYHSYIIPISFLYHSYIIPISFLYHSYIIPISFLYHSYIIPFKQETFTYRYRHNISFRTSDFSNDISLKAASSLPF